MKRPPITGMPAKRPHCANCDRLFKPFVLNTYARYTPGEVRPLVASEFVRWNAYGDIFCTLRCALNFALDSHSAGFRRRK